MFFRLKLFNHNAQPTLQRQRAARPTLVLVDRISIFPALFSLADRIHDLISLSWSLFQFFPEQKAASPQSISSEVSERESCSISKEEVKSVMEKLELVCSQEEEEGIEECFGADEVRAIFYESEPSLEELNQTFNVFDKNRDGFIDAAELHTVLGLLGSNRGIFIHDCQRMIARFDYNNDGKIDFNEFVKFMEIALS